MTSPDGEWRDDWLNYGRDTYNGRPDAWELREEDERDEQRRRKQIRDEWGG